jgi:probable HAF family extracellular repeat protein
MKNICKIGLAFTATAVLNIAVSKSAVAATMHSITEYSITDLGDLDSIYPDSYSYSRGINNNGEVVGFSHTSQGNRAFLWNSQNGMSNLGILDNSKSDFTSNIPTYAYSINDKSQVVGSVKTSGGVSAFLWDKTGGIENLGTLDSKVTDNYYNLATDINNKTQVVGYSYTNNGYRAFLWDREKGIQNLGALDTPNNGYGNSYATDINNQSQVVGYSLTNQGWRPFLWENGTIKNLGILSNDNIHSYNNSYATAINDKGQIIGYVSSPDGGSQAIRWENGLIQQLGSLYNTAAIAINSKGQTVGYSYENLQQPFLYRAILWENNMAYDLNTLISSDSGWTLNSAVAINDLGEIIGNGEFQGKRKTFALKPKQSLKTQVPEFTPTFSLFAFSSLYLSLGFLRAKKNHLLAK